MPDKVSVRFDITNPRAETLIAQRSSEQITAITQSTRDSVRKVLTEGYEKGRGPNEIALDIIGRVNRTTGNREGGIIGLTAAQTQAALNLRSRLSSGNPTEMRAVLSMGLRDKRFDSTIESAIEKGERISSDQIDLMYRRYVSNALRFRGEMIARTETGQAVLEAAHEAFQQGLEKTGYDDKAVVKVWRTSRDRRVRDSHAAMDGQTVRGLSAAFTSPDSGARFLYPMDDSLGAPASEIINCRCLCEYNLDFSAGLTPDRDLNPPPTPPPAPIEPPPTPEPAPEPDLTNPENWDTAAVALKAFAEIHGFPVRSIGKHISEAKLVSKVRETHDTLNDLYDRHPNFVDHMKVSELRLDADLLETRRANGTYHLIDNTLTMDVGSLEAGSTPLAFGEFSISSGVERVSRYQGTLRHELGHAVTTNFLQSSGLTLADVRRMMGLATEVSRYAAANEYEFLAESFAAWSHPDYLKQSRRINPRLEALFNQYFGRK